MIDAYETMPGAGAEGVLAQGVEHQQEEGIELQSKRPHFLSRIGDVVGRIVENRKNAFFAHSEPLTHNLGFNSELNQRLKEIRASIQEIEYEKHPEFTASTFAD